MNLTVLLIIIGAIIVVAGLFAFMVGKQYHKAGPNEVLIISGGRKRTITDADGNRVKVGYRMQIGGGTFVKPFVETTQTLPLETYTINFRTPEVLTREGVHIVAEFSAQVKVASDEASIRRAAEQFLGRGAAAIKEVSENILEGYVRSALGALSVEELYQQRDQFNRQVRQSAESDFAKMGIELLAFALKDISDTQGYLHAIGAPRIAQVKRDAAIAQAETEKDTVIKTALAHKEGEVARYQVESEIAAASHDYELQRAEFQADINVKRAQSDIAYEIERAKYAAELKKSEYQVRLVEKEAAIQVEEMEIKRRELELESSVKKPAEARQFQIEAEAEAEKRRLILEAQGKADAHKTEGLAAVEVKKAEGISRIEYTRHLGKAEAEAMSAKAEAYKAYNDAAVSQMFIDKLPELARAVSEPLSKVDKIVMVGDGANGASRLTGQVASVLSQLPEVVEAVSGIDLKKVLGKKDK
ncbi:MAG: flotillin [Calditrichaeota bacterium]|nr:flotillin [Calditrichota bacterium]